MITLLYDLLFGSVLALAALFSVCPLIGTDPVPKEYIICTLGFCTLAVLMRRWKTRGRLILAGCTAAAAAGVFLTVPKSERLLFLQSHLWVLVILLGSILCVLLVWLAELWRPVKLLPAVVAILLAGMFLVQGRQDVRNAVLFILLYLLLLAGEAVQRRWEKEGSTGVKAHMVYTAPFIALPVIILLSVSMPEEPYRWEFVRNIVSDARSGYEMLIQSLNLKHSWDNSEAEVGFSEEAEFFGNLKDVPYEVLRINTVGISPGTRIYLSGRSFDSFDGRRWQKTDASQENYRMYDLLETLSAVIEYDGEDIRDYVRTSGLEIECRGIRTAHVFMPDKTMPQIRNRATVQEGGDLWFTDRKRGEYRMDYCRINRRYEEFEALAKNPPSGIPDTEAVEAAAKVLQGLDVSGYTPQGLRNYRSAMQEIYCPKTEVSERTAAYLEEQLAGAESDYEKLVRLEELLSEMTYTISPGELPENVNSPAEYLDYLLFDSQQGYCTHFATAFVLLARAEGIPARYEQGYYVAAGDNPTKVLSNRSHAWAGAYIEGIGWLTFDPTPGFRKTPGWLVIEREQNTDGTAVTYMGTDDEEEEEETETASDVISDLQNPAAKDRTRLPLLLAALFLVLYLPADYLIRKIRFRRMSAREKARSLCSRCLRILRRLGYRPQPGETLSEFAAKASETVPAEYLGFLGAYEEILYRERAVTDKDIALFETNASQLLQFWLKRLFRRREKPDEAEIPEEKGTDSPENIG